jgi:hypothetical protein
MPPHNAAAPDRQRKNSMTDAIDRIKHRPDN